MTSFNDAVRISEVGGKVSVVTPYNSRAIDRFRELAGKWDRGSSAWMFDLRDMDRVVAAVEEIFGPITRTGELVTMRYVVPNRYNPATLAGRVIAERRGRDYGVRLGDGIVVVEGRFPSSGGSRANPKLGHYTGDVVVEIRDVDRAMVDFLIDAGAELAE